MYAVINIPGSSHFEYHGPDTRANCEAWLSARVEVLGRTELVTSLMPQRILSNRAVAEWRYRDGTRVIKRWAM